jgi:hypothetical protein
LDKLWRRSFKYVVKYQLIVDHTMPKEKSFESYMLSKLSNELNFLDILRYGY